MEASRLSAADAARRLGVKRETLYAYVSRGMLTSHRQPGSKESGFDAAEITRLAARRRGGGRAGNLEMVVDSSVSLLDPLGRLWYRGWDAEEACKQASYEEVAEWIWSVEETRPGSRAVAGGVRPKGGVRSGTAFAATGECLEAAVASLSAISPSARPVDRLRLALLAGGTADALRHDRRPEAVAATAHRIIGLLVDTLPTLTAGAPRDGGRSESGRGNGGGSGPSDGSGSGPSDGSGSGPSDGGGTVEPVAARLWVRLSPLPLTPERQAALNTALVLLADHEMASSTLAARVAASTWADPYLVVSAGLAILGGPLHGGASDRILSLLSEAATHGAAEAIGARWRVGDAVPGFGHMVYTRRDPRAEALWLVLQRWWPDHRLVVATQDIIDTVTAHGEAFPNVDLLLATLIGTGEMVEGSGEAIFALARTAGWLAHAIEEYQHRLRFRFRAAYTGPSPE